MLMTTRVSRKNHLRILAMGVSVTLLTSPWSNLEAADKTPNKASIFCSTIYSRLTTQISQFFNHPAQDIEIPVNKTPPPVAAAVQIASKPLTMAQIAEMDQALRGDFVSLRAQASDGSVRTYSSQILSRFHEDGTEVAFLVRFFNPTTQKVSERIMSKRQFAASLPTVASEEQKTLLAQAVAADPTLKDPLDIYYTIERQNETHLKLSIQKRLEKETEIRAKADKLLGFQVETHELSPAEFERLAGERLPIDFAFSKEDEDFVKQLTRQNKERIAAENVKYQNFLKEHPTPVVPPHISAYSTNYLYIHGYSEMGANQIMPAEVLGKAPGTAPDTYLVRQFYDLTRGRYRDKVMTLKELDAMDARSAESAADEIHTFKEVHHVEKPSFQGIY